MSPRYCACCGLPSDEWLMPLDNGDEPDWLVCHKCLARDLEPEAEE